MDKLLKLIKFIPSPFEDDRMSLESEQKGATPDSLIAGIVDKVLANLEILSSEANKTFLANTSSLCTWRLSCTIIELLIQLKRTILQIETTQTEEENSIELLSLQDQIYVQKCVELLIGFGLRPYLLPGVGLPSQVRSDRPTSSLNYNIQQEFSKEDISIPEFDKFLHLHHVLTSILDIIEYPTLCFIFIPKYLTDLLPALLQQTKLPLAKPNPSQEPSKKRGSSLTQAQFNEASSCQSKINEKMSDLLQTIPKKHLVSTLLIIGGSPHLWLQRACTGILHGVLSSKNGLISTSHGIYENFGSGGVETAAKVLSNLLRSILLPFSMQKQNISQPQNPHQSTDLPSLCSQCVEMIWAPIKHARKGGELSNDPARDLNKDMGYIGLVCALTLTDFDGEMTQKMIWARIFGPLLVLSQESPSNNTHKQLLGSSLQELEECGSLATSLLVATSSMNKFGSRVSSPKIFKLLWPLFFSLYATTSSYLAKKDQEPSLSAKCMPLKHLTEELLLNHIESTEENHSHLCFKLLSNSALFRYEFVTHSLNFGAELKAEEVVDGEGIKIERQRVGGNVLGMLSDDIVILSRGLLRNVRLKRFSSDLLLQLIASSHGGANTSQSTSRGDSMDRKNEDGGGAKDRGEMPDSAKTDTTLGKLSEQLDLDLDENVCKFIRLKLLEELAGEEPLVKECLGQGLDESLHLLESILRNFVNESKGSPEEFPFAESLSNSLDLLSTIVESLKTPNPQLIDQPLVKSWSTLERFIPILKELSESKNKCFLKAGLLQTASDLLISIQTKGLGLMRNEPKAQATSRWEEAASDAMNPQPAIKGHGLLELRKLLEEGVPESTSEEAQTWLLNIFKKEIKNSDSYVYLMAIQGLAALGSRHHKVVIPVLVEEYQNKKNTTEEDDGEEVNFRLKIGEVIVKIVRGLGESATEYRGMLSGAFFHLISDPDPLIRTSALSNMAELCYLLRFSLGSILTDVWNCIYKLLQSETVPEVRRGALHLIVLLLRGVANNTEDLPLLLRSQPQLGAYLRDVLRLLRGLRENEKDPACCLHAQIALDELDLIARSLLTSSNPELKYKIQVLDH